MLWRKCFKLNLQRSGTKAEMCHNGCWHPERTNELIQLMNEPVFHVLGTMPTSCSSVTPVLTSPRGLCAAAKLGGTPASQLPAQGTASARQGAGASPTISTPKWSWVPSEGVQFSSLQTWEAGKRNSLASAHPLSRGELGSLDLHHQLHLPNQVSLSHSCSFPWGEDAGREVT